MQQNFARRLATGLIVATLMFGAFLAGNVTGWMARPVLAQRDTPAEFDVFWEAWDLVVEYFVDRDQVDYTAMTYGAIQGMLNSLGDENHTVFFSPEVAKQQASALEGSFESIGAYVSLEEELFTIVAPILGSPAEKAGILAGDVVLAVDGTEINGMEEWEVISLIRGPAGSAVVLTVLHPDEETPVDIPVQRGRIDIDSVMWARVPGTEMVQIQITQFAADTGRELKKALQEIQAERDAGTPVAGIMLDLRNNPGGYLQEALRVAGEFLEKGAIIVHERDAQGKITTHRALATGLAADLPLVVLVNQGSASAAEIVAGALQDNGRGKIVGMPTVGTGTVLHPFTLSDGSVVRLGVANWLTPDYSLIKGQGIMPDMRIDQEASVEMMSTLQLEQLTPEEVRLHGDRQFQAALLWLNVRHQPQESMTASQPPTP